MAVLVGAAAAADRHGRDSQGLVENATRFSTLRIYGSIAAMPVRRSDRSYRADVPVGAAHGRDRPTRPYTSTTANGCPSRRRNSSRKAGAKARAGQWLKMKPRSEKAQGWGKSKPLMSSS